MEALKYRRRDEFWQAVRGICILAVIMLHCPDGSSYAIGSTEFTIWAILKQFISFPVAMFIFLSGYFVNFEYCEQNTKKYLLTRGGGRLLIPFILWSIFYSAISVVNQLIAGESIGWLGYAYRFIIGKACTPFYYIVVLFQLTLLTPWLIGLIRRAKLLSKMLWLVTPLYLILIYYWNFIGEVPEIYGTLFPAWFVFYYLGMNIRLNGKKWRKIIDKFGQWYILCLMLLVSLSETGLLLSINMSKSFALSQIRVGSFLYTAILIFILLKVHRICCNKNDSAKGLATRALAQVGDLSYGIFFIHCFILGYIKKICVFIGVDSIWGLYFILTWLVVSVISYLIVWVINRDLEKSELGLNLLRWLGFR